MPFNRLHFWIQVPYLIRISCSFVVFLAFHSVGSNQLHSKWAALYISGCWPLWQLFNGTLSTKFNCFVRVFDALNWLNGLCVIFAVAKMLANRSSVFAYSLIGRLVFPLYHGNQRNGRARIYIICLDIIDSYIDIIGTRAKIHFECVVLISKRRAICIIFTWKRQDYQSKMFITQNQCSCGEWVNEKELGSCSIHNTRLDGRQKRLGHIASYNPIWNQPSLFILSFNAWNMATHIVPMSVYILWHNLYVNVIRI